MHVKFWKDNLNIVQDNCFHSFIDCLFPFLKREPNSKFYWFLGTFTSNLWHLEMKSKGKALGLKCDTNWLTAEKIFAWSKLPETPYESDMEEDLISKFGSVFIKKDSLQSPSNFMKFMTNFESNYLLLFKTVILKCCFRLQAWGPRNE